MVNVFIVQYRVPHHNKYCSIALKPVHFSLDFAFAGQLPKKCYLDGIEPLPQQEPLATYGCDPRDLTLSHSPSTL